VAGILAALKVADDELAPHLAWALARTRGEAGSTALVEALSTGNVAARKAAAPTLAALSTWEGQRALRHAATHDADAEVRRICNLLLTR
jgi:hypothetical protein